MKTGCLRQVGTASSVWRLLLALLICLAYSIASPAIGAPLTINVVSVDRSGAQTPITNYRWTVEEDVTKASVPGEHATRNHYSFGFHSSYMPVVAAGKVSGGTPLVGCDSNPNNPIGCADPDRQSMPMPDLNPNKRYYVSVLPDDGSAMGGAPVKFVATGPTATVYVNKYPLPTAQISVFVFEDNSPLNSAPDLPQEQGLAGFTIFLTEAGGTYGGSGGQVTQDAFGNPLGTTYQYDSAGQPVLDASGSPTMVKRGTGIIKSGPDGVAVIKNLFPAKYTIQVIPPTGSDWHQTSTIEGTKGDDAWVKHGEPSFFQEFGPPGHHVFTGFTHTGFIATNAQPDGTTTPVLNGTTSVIGRVVNLHNSRPPNYQFTPTPGITNPTATPMEGCYVGLNEPGGGRSLYVAPCKADSTFAIPNVPPGIYELVVFDDPLDIIISLSNFAVPAGEETHDLGDVPVFSWFGRYQGRVFYDANGNGFPDPEETTGIPDQVLNIRFRDGSIYQSTLSNAKGEFKFTEVFPFFNWMIAEVDYGRFKATGATIVVDAGGPVPAHNGWTTPSFNRLNPQLQPDGLPYRTETGVVLLEGMQTFLSQTNHIEWGKKMYSGQENGGIAGIVQYGITRAEDDPKNGTAETWEPGVPRVQVNLYVDCDRDGKPDQPSANGDGTCAAGGLSSGGYVYDKPDVDNFPFCWRDAQFVADNPTLCPDGQAMGPEDRKRSANGGTAFSYGDVFTWGDVDPTTGARAHVGLGKTDGWDDALPTGCPVDANGAYQIPYGPDAGFALDCYDGLRNWNQVRPAVFDGGYAFGSVAGQANLPNVRYIVEAVAPPGYFHQGNGDKNVVFGDTVAPAPLAPMPECVGMDLPVPQYLSLFPDAQEPNILYKGAGQTWKKCDMKVADMQPGRNLAPNFFLYTEAPIAGHGVGFILDDLSSEFDVNAPTFGEKHAPPHLPVSIHDWTGREISRVYADEFGSYNFLVPSTFTINPPFPSGVGPSMMVSCMNSPGPIPDPSGAIDPNTGTTRMVIDPYFNRQYSQFCYTLQYLPGKTTYLDTPVVPVAAYAGRTQNPLDCDDADGTPMIYSVTGNGPVQGPWLPQGAGGQLTIISAGNTDVLNPYYDPAITGSAKIMKRDYGFGAVKGSVVIGGTVLSGSAITTWNNDMIVVALPASASTGQLTVIRGDNNASSKVGVTVTIESATPKSVLPGGSIQAVIDNPLTQDGDLVLVPPGTYYEYVIMDKKIRLQGWGAMSTTINAAKIGTEALKKWRTLINRKIDARQNNVIDPDTGLRTVVAGPNRTFDLLPGQTLGTNLSNNEPLLFGAEEGPGVLVVAKRAASGAGNGHFNNTPNARIDGLTVTGADYGGGILASGYARFLQISNNRVVGNYGTYGGGVRVGHTELLDETNTAFGGYTDSVNPDVKIFNNWIAENGSTEAGAGGGVTLGNGATRYQVTSNQICGNFSMASGGGIGHLGLSNAGMIADNQIIFNQTFNQSANPTGGGIFVGGAPSLTANGLSPGSGSVTITRNLVLGNNAGAGAGGGISLANVNGLDVSRAPANTTPWNKITLTNNMVADNVSGYAGGGVVVQNALIVNASNNTIANNDSTATNQQSFTTTSSNTSNAQPAGLVSLANTSALQTAIGNPTGPNAADAYVRYLKATPFSDVKLFNNVLWHNRSFCWAITGTGPGQYGVFDLNADGSCNTGSPAGTSPTYVDLGVLGTANQGTIAGRFAGPVDKLTPDHSILSDLLGATGYDNRGNQAADPMFVLSYTNRSSKPAPIIRAGGDFDTAATLDEGGNFIEVRFGPLTRWNCLDATGAVKSPQTAANCPLFGDYHLKAGSPAINRGANTLVGYPVTGINTASPTVDYDNAPRARTATDPVDVGADEVAAP